MWGGPSGRGECCSPVHCVHCSTMSAHTRLPGQVEYSPMQGAGGGIEAEAPSTSSANAVARTAMTAWRRGGIAIGGRGEGEEGRNVKLNLATTWVAFTDHPRAFPEKPWPSCCLRRSTLSPLPLASPLPHHTRTHACTALPSTPLAATWQRAPITATWRCGTWTRTWCVRVHVKKHVFSCIQYG